MITRLIWTTWTSPSVAREKLLNLITQSLQGAKCCVFCSATINTALWTHLLCCVPRLPPIYVTVILWNNAGTTEHPGYQEYLHHIHNIVHIPGVILGMASANERWFYNVALSVIRGLAHSQNEPCIRLQRKNCQYDVDEILIPWFISLIYSRLY